MIKSLPIILKNQKILLIGAGKVAKDKLDVLKDNGYLPTIISQDNKYGFENTIIKKIEVDDCRGFNIVIDASGDDKVRDIVFEAKVKYNFLLNRVDSPKDCDFYFSSLINMNYLKIAISTNGASPTVGQEIRNFIQRVLPDDLSSLLEVKASERKNNIINIDKTRKQIKKKLGIVYLIGCGIGDVELLTIKAYNLIQQMDVVFIDHLISDEILDIVPKSTKQIYIGKQKDKLITTQEEINHLLLEYASKGLRVARLKSGDPYIFGRGAEEAMFLDEKGIRVEVIAGVSSPIAGALSAGIAPTARGYSANLSIVTAHLRGNHINMEWIDVLKMENHTTIVLMAISKANEIKQEALKFGVDKNLPTAIVSNASRKNQKVFITTLDNFPQEATKALKPAFVIFGNVVNLYGKLPINKRSQVYGV